MTYWALNAPFLGAAVLVALSAVLARRAPRWRVLGLTLLGVLLLTAVFDNVLVGTGIVGYDEALISGAFVGVAPIEDFAYSIAAVLLLPSLWMLLGKRGRCGRARGREVIRALLLTSRPLSWVNTAFPFAAAYVVASGRVDVTLIVGTLFFLVPYNLAMYGINDVFDYESDLRNPRKGGVEGALLQPRWHRATLWASGVIAVPFVIYLVVAGGPASWIVLAISLFAVLAYSVKGLRFKERPFLDSVTSSTHFVSPAVYALALVGASFTPGLVALLVAYFLWGAASHAFGAVQDVVADREGGIGSVATVIGARATVRLAVALYVLAGILLVVCAVLGGGWPAAVAAVLPVPYAINALPWWNVDDGSAPTANRGWRRFLWLNFVTGFAVTMLLIGYVLTR